MAAISPRLRTQRASDLINLETYTDDTHLIVTKAAGDSLFVGRTYVASPLVGSGYEFANVIQNVFKSVPDDSVIQVSLLCAPDRDAPANFRRNKDRGSEVITELVERQCKLFEAAAHTGWKEDLPILNVRKVLISLAIPTRSVDDKTLEDAARLQAEFLGNIKGCGFRDAEVLSAAQLVGLYRHIARIFEVRQTPELDDLVDLRLQVFGPDDTIDFRDPRVGIFNGSTYCASVTCKAFPRKPAHGLMNLACGAPFNSGPTTEGGGQRIATPFVVTTTVRVANQRKELDRVTRAIDSRKQKQLPLRLGNEDPVDKLADLTKIKAQCSETDNKFVYVSTSAFLFGTSHEQVINASSVVKGTLNKLGFDARDVLNNGLARWAQMLPLNFSPKLADQLAGEALMSASAACCLLPVYGDYLGNVGPRSQRTGAAFVTRRGSIHRFDPFSSNSHFSGVICAPPGAGKSVVLQELITCDLASGTKVILLDNGRSAKKFALGAGGKFYEFKFGGSGISASLNPFSGLDDDTFAEQQEGITSLVLLMAFYREEVDPGARIAAGEAVKAAWGQKRGDASLSTVLEALEQIERGGAERSTKSEPIIAATNLIPRLRAFIESPTRGPFFNGKGSIDISNQLCVFELGSLGDDHHLKKCVLYFLMNVLMTRLVGSNTPTLIYIDEAHDVMDDEGAASALNGLYQKGRKDKIGTWPVLQSIDKLTQSPAGRVIWNMSAWKLILQQTPEELGTVLKHELLSSFARDPYFERLLRSVETRKGDFSEVLILGERSYEAARLYLDPFTLMLFGSEGAARDDVFLLMERGMHPIAAVEQVLGEKKAKRRAWIREFLQQLRRADGMSALEVAREIREGMEDAA